MAASLLALLDDITSMLDDVSLMTKVATKKTVGVLGDDLALNARQVAGASPNRELPVVLAVAAGSLVNKAVLIPAALLISAFAPWLITPLLMLGGSYLCFEGAEKIVDWLRKRRGQSPAGSHALVPPGRNEEKRKVLGAIRTDFILSTEIIVIALGTLPQNSPVWEKALALSLVGLCVTAGVYGFVAAIVKLDDLGLWLVNLQPGKGAGDLIGSLLIKAMPWLMRFLTVAGTLAMFLVGGGIVAHGIPVLEVRIESLSGLFLPGMSGALLHMAVGLTLGLGIVGLGECIRWLRQK